MEVLHHFINDTLVIELEQPIKLKTAELRKAHRIKLPDAIIAASCLDFTPPAILVTENDLDFRYEENGIQKIVAGLVVERVG